MTIHDGKTEGCYCEDHRMWLDWSPALGRFVCPAQIDCREYGAAGLSKT